jgi:hypothetical protein
MEHFVIRYLIHLVRRLNRFSQKPLHTVIPEFEELRADPDRVLQKSTIEIGPGRRYGSIFAVTLASSFILWALTCAGLIAVLDQGPPAQAKRLTAVVVPLWIIGPALIALVAKRFFDARGGQAVLHRDGVVLSSRQELVFCPWRLFDTPGSPVRIHPDRVIVPVAGEGLSSIVVERRGFPADNERVHTRPLSCKPGNEVVLRELYEVNVLDLAWLLLFLGRRLTDGAWGSESIATAGRSEISTEAKVAWQVKGGWIGVRLSRLSLPRECCGCGQSTDSQQPIRLSSGFHAFDESQSLTLFIPVCPSCQRLGKRRARKRVFRGLLMAAFLLFGLSVLTLVLAGCDAPIGLTAVSCMAAVVVPVLFGARAVSSRHRFSAPVQARRYSPNSGTVELHFDRREYGQALLSE